MPQGGPAGVAEAGAAKAGVARSRREQPRAAMEVCEQPCRPGANHRGQGAAREAREQPGMAAHNPSHIHSSKIVSKYVSNIILK